MAEQKPSVGRIVHCVSHGTPPDDDGHQAHPSACRAAIVTDVWNQIGTAGLAVLNPAGIFFDVASHDEDEKPGGTWHWPERT